MGLFDIFKKKEMDIIVPVEEQTIVTNTPQIANSEPIGPYIMEIEDVFTISGRGTIVTGKIASGELLLNDIVEIKETGKQVQVAGIEQFRKQADKAMAGESVGLLLSNISRDEIERGYHIVK